MSKDFTEVVFNPVQFKKELDQFRDFLNSKKILGEREIQALFKASLHLTARVVRTFVSVRPTGVIDVHGLMSSKGGQDHGSRQAA
jgi:hypothetical protein